MTNDTRDEKERGAAARTAAEWFVELDADGIDAGDEAAFGAWLEENETRERELERCEAAVRLAAELKDDPDVHWMFADAARIAASARGIAAERGSRNVQPWVSWYREPVLAWGIAASAVVVAVIAVAWREPESASTTAIAANGALPAEVVIQLAAADPVAVLPGDVIVDAQSVAVLPFVSIAEQSDIGGDTNAIASQLYDDVVRQLATIPGVYVVGRPSVAPYESRDLRPEEVAAQLGVRGIVAARVATDNGRVRVLLQVIDVAGDGGSEDAFERPVAELTAMRTDIVTNIAAALASPVVLVEPAR